MKPNYSLIIFIFLLSPLFAAFSQNENNYWFFGNNAGLDFSSGSVVPITGNLNTLEGCASISTSSGNLLFYTDGITVYNKTGAIMTNGNGLLGNPSSTSSAIIVPRPCTDTQYFVFTVDYVSGTNGINYSLVEMDDNNDGVYDPVTEDGSVVASMKNINLPGPTGERICAVKHSNGVDYFVTATQKNTNNFYTYLITNAGVSVSINQSLGSILSAGYYMKYSPDGTKLALTNGSTSEVFIYDFDNVTGGISNPQLVGIVPIRPYGIEFSPDSQKLFYSDFANGNGTGIGFIYEVVVQPTLGTPVQIASVPNQGGRYALGALQQSPVDPNIIYVAMDGEMFLGEIDIASSSFNRTALPLLNTCYLGLPTFVSGQISTSCLNLEPYTNAIPDLAPQTVADELSDLGIIGKDKEYGDTDNDGDIDIVYTKNNKEIHLLINTAGANNTPVYTVPGTSTGIEGSNSFRLFDWDADGWNDLIVHGEDPFGAAPGVFLYLNNGNGTYPTVPTARLLEAFVHFPYIEDQLIALGDLNNDVLPDLLISGQSIEIYGTAYFENTGTTSPYFILTGSQGYSLGDPSITNVFIPENNGSYPTPEIFDADCDGDLDLFISDPLLPNPPYGGARMYYHENNGGNTSGTLPDVTISGVINQFGLEDTPGVYDLQCDWIITRFVDYKTDGCPIAISFNPCTDQFYYYDQDCSCESILNINENQLNDSNLKLYPNPTQSVINLELDSNKTIDSIIIYSFTGAEIKRINNDVNSIEVSDLSSGIYFIKAFIGGTSITKKFIKL